MGEIEGRVTPFARDRGTRIPPLKAPRDHQVDNGEEIVVQAENHPLPKPGEATHDLAVHFADRRIPGLEEGGRPYSQALDRLAHDPGTQRMKVEVDLGKFRHRARPGSGRTA